MLSMRLPHTIREHEPFEARDGLTKEDLKSLNAIWQASATPDKNGATSPVFSRRRDGALTASNYVGVLTTRRQTVIEILPKIDLGDQDDPKHEETKTHFLKMLRSYRGLRRAAQLPESSIREMKRFPMLEVFIRQFLGNLHMLVRGGLARRYLPIEENLPHLRGRILFRDHIRNNLTNQARFFVAHDELSINRPANRLIHKALTMLRPQVRSEENRQLLRELSVAFADVPQTVNPHADWRKHCVDRSMRHYGPVMQWVGMFLFRHGLTTFAGRHANLSLLFPMEQVFEDFVTHSFRRYQDEYTVAAQGPRRYLATFKDQDTFKMEPDISLRRGNRIAFILDAKWKRINARATDRKHEINQADMYQLYAYGKRYGCETVALVYPQSRQFSQPLRYRFQEAVKSSESKLTLICLPFDVSEPQESVDRALRELEATPSSTRCLA